MKKIIIYVLVMTISLFSCKFGTNGSMKSGTIYDDDIEEPLADPEIKYENNLNISNTIIDNLKVNNYKSIYNDLFSEEFKKILTFDKYSQMMDNIFHKAGPIASYKKLQWNFKLYSQGGRKFLSSTKIVHHKNATLYYIFVFDQDNLKNLVGLQFNEIQQKK